MAVIPVQPTAPVIISTVGPSSRVVPKAHEHATPRRSTSVKLSVPIDAAFIEDEPNMSQTHKVSGRHTPVRRDSLERREALLKGKEGSRQRRRWENDRLLSNPWAVAPLASDWEVRPTYPTRSVPYYLAPLWDAAEFQRTVEAKLSNKSKHGRKTSSHGRTYMSPAEEAASNVPKEVRAKLKRARAAKGLLQDLEEQVRIFLVKWNDRQRMRETEGLGDVSRPTTPTNHMSSSFHVVHRPKPGHVQNESALLSDEDSDDEIVFIGRTADAEKTPTMLDSPGRAQREIEAGFESLTRDKMVFEGLETDKGAGFARYLVHRIGEYYGLKTWSVNTAGEPVLRSAYVGVDRRGWGCGRGVARRSAVELPLPLYGMV